MIDDIPRKVDLGCGREKQNGWYGVDIVETESVDQVQDLDEESWDLPSNHFKKVRAIDVFEHLENPIGFMEEIYRIAQDGAEIHIQGPHFSSGNWHDPTHVRLLGSRSMEHFTDKSRFDFYTDAEFLVEDIRITFEWSSSPVYIHIATYIANQFTRLYETTLLRNVLPATNISFHLRVVKP